MYCHVDIYLVHTLRHVLVTKVRSASNGLSATSMIIIHVHIIIRKYPPVVQWVLEIQVAQAGLSCLRGLLGPRMKVHILNSSIHLYISANEKFINIRLF